MGMVLDLVLVALVLAALFWWWGVRSRAAEPRRKDPAVARPPRPPVLSTLGEAIAASDLERVRGCLDDGADPDDPARDDMPALFAAVAAWEGDDRVVRLLLERGANREHVDPLSGSALSLALMRRAHPLAHLLLDAGVPTDARSENGATALHMAALSGDAGFTTLLLARGIPVDMRSHQQGTPLRTASQAGHAELVELLLASGAKPDVVDVFGKTPADWARKEGHEEIGRILDGASPRGAVAPPPRPREGGPASIRAIPWRRGDSAIRIAEHAVREGITLVDAASTSLEAPSAVRSLRRALGPQYRISASLRDAHDPRDPIGDVSFRLWTYEDIEAQPTVTPSAEMRARVGALARRPYALGPWSARAKTIASGLDEDAIDDVLAVMTDPPDGPSYLEPWDFWFRAQIAAALIVSHVGTKPWGESKRRARLLDLTRGPADWANAAAMVALFDVATREPETRAEIREALLALTRIEMTPPRYQHVMRPAALVLREIGDLDRETASALDELIHPPMDDE